MRIFGTQMRLGEGFTSEIFFEVTKMNDICRQGFTVIFTKDVKREEILDDSSVNS